VRKTAILALKSGKTGSEQLKTTHENKFRVQVAPRDTDVKHPPIHRRKRIYKEHRGSQMIRIAPV